MSRSSATSLATRKAVLAGLGCLTVALAQAAGCSSCNKGPTYDLDSPEAALNSFERAINDDNFPRDINRLISSDVEQRKWRLRCKSRGCKKATFSIVGQGERSDYNAVLMAKFVVHGNLGGEVLAGQRTPIRLERVGASWFIAEIGTEIATDGKPAARLRRAPPADGGTPAGGEQVDAGPPE